MEQLLPIIFSGLIALGAIIGLINTTRLWNKTHRPIVSAAVITHDEQGQSIRYNLMVLNSGNRPAVEVRLKARNTDLDRCLNQDSPDTSFIENIRACFTDASVIPLLCNDKSVSNAFGFTKEPDTQGTWKYGSTLPIQIKYKDMEGRRYTSKLTLFIKYSEAFAGMPWI